ncbi:MAG: MerR family transcriptional regulator [Desulfobacterales bacterium]
MKTKTSDRVDLPDKLYFKIGEVAEIAKVPTYVLRFWETEFARLKPKRTRSGQRLYRKSDVELILKVKHLLYDQKYTIKGAKQHLFPRFQAGGKKSDPPTLREIRSELEKIRALLA